MGSGQKKITAVILAGGDSRRLSGYNMPKQLIDINGKYVISYCLDIYQNLEIIDSIILVINDNYRSLFNSIVNDGNYSKVEKMVPGGEYRQKSIFNGISSIDSCDFVVIHNGVCIFTPPDLIKQCVETAKTRKAVSAFLRETYTSFLFENDRIKSPLDRSFLGHVRDPQVIDFQLLLALHKKALNEKKITFTNDVLLLWEYGQEVHLVESPPDNFKITNNIDIKLAKVLIDSR